MSAASSAPRAGRGLALWLTAALAIGPLGGCVMRRMSSPRLTGTCAGACAHYASCKGSARREERARCLAECPEVFGDADSLMAFESLACRDAVEYVDGAQRPTAEPRS